MRQIYKLLLLFIIAITVGRCAQSDLSGGDLSDMGKIELSVAERQQSLIVKSSDDTSERVYSLKVYNSDSTLVKTYSDHTAIEDELWVFAGEYRVVAEYGTEVEAAFDSPHYYGEETFDVIGDQVSTVDVATSLTSIGLSISFSDQFDDYFSDYSTSVTNELINLIYETGEERAGYFKVNPDNDVLSYVLRLTPLAGGDTYQYSGEISGVKANDFYLLSFSLDESFESTGAIRINAIVVNQNVNSSDSDMSIYVVRYPEIEGDGFDIDDEQSFLDSETDKSFSIIFTAFPTLQGVTVTYDCEYLSTHPGASDYQTFDLVSVASTPSKVNDLLDLGINVSSDSTEYCTNEITFELTASFLSNTSLENGTYSFTFNAIDSNDITLSKTLTFTKTDKKIITRTPDENEVWATFCPITIEYKTDDTPTEVGVKYWVDGEIENSQVLTDAVYDEESKTVSGTIRGLSASTEYYIEGYAVVNGATEEGTTITITTDDIVELYNGGFENWYTSSSTYYPNESGVQFWDSGNSGANTVSTLNPTSPESSDVYSGTYSIKMETKLVDVIIYSKLAAGNVFTGEFVGLSGVTPTLSFGQPFSARPTKLKGYYKYNSVTIDNSDGDYTSLQGEADRFHIWCLICTEDKMPRFHYGDGSPFNLSQIKSQGYENTVTSNSVDYGTTAICFGEFTSEDSDGNASAVSMSAYQKFEIDLTYYKDNFSLEPAYLVIACTASKYGDYYTGGEGSVLLMDNLEFEYDEPTWDK